MTDDVALTIREPARAVDVVHRVPVLVVGGGPSGLAAAIAAARAGAEVSLLERFGCFGGNLTVVGSRAWPGTGMRRPVRNLLVAGRAIGGDRIAHAAHPQHGLLRGHRAGRGDRRRAVRAYRPALPPA